VSHPFGELLREYRRRKPGLTQERLAHRVGYDPAVLVRMAQGKKDLTGPSGRERVVRLIEVLREDGALLAVEEANALLAAASQPPLYDGIPLERALIRALRPAPSARPVAIRFTLPAPVSSLVGREGDVERITEILQRARLLTLTGAGGSGKTRLALEVAESFADDFVHGACFVSLAAVRRASDVGPTIARALDVHDVGGRSLVEAISRFLSNKSVLLVLDNFEHVLSEAVLAYEFLIAAPMLKIIATSREPLRISGEHVYPVEPLALASAEALFEERARAVKLDFSMEGSARDVAEICERLDRLPLAIELAAARVAQFSPRVMLGRLSEAGAKSPLSVLWTASRDAPARHRTLRDTIAWSYELLTAREQDLLRTLGVFVNGAEVEQIAAAEPESGIERRALEEMLASLVDKNLARRVEQADGMPRFLLLELIREFALEQLRENSALTEARRRHASAFAALAELSAGPIRGHAQRYWRNRIERDYANFRSALVWTFGPTGDNVIGCRLVGALAHFWFIATRYLNDTREWTNTALGALTAEMPPAVLGDVCASLIINGHLWKRAEWIAPSRAALVHYGAIQNQRGICLGLYGLAAGLLGDKPNDAEGLRACDEGLALAKAIGDQWMMAHILHILAANALDMGDFRNAETWYREMVSIRRSIGNDVEVAIGLWQYAEVLSRTLRFREAIGCLRESTRLASQIDSPQDVVHADSAIGENMRLCGEFSEASSILEDAIALARDQLPTEDVIFPLISLGKTFIRLGDHAQSRALLHEAATTVRSTSGSVPTFHFDRREILDAFAMLASAAEDASRAARLWGAADRLWAGNVTPRRPQSAWEYAPYMEKAWAALGDAAHEAALAEGRALTVEQALAYALGES
jgi:predicted ATPase